VLLTGFPSAVFATNCYVVAPAEGEECLVVDPGVDVLERLADVLAGHRLRPAAVLLTHGHLDHVYSVTPVCSEHGIAAYIHPDDAYRLRDPLGSLDPALVAMLQAQFGRRATWREPANVIAVDGSRTLRLAGLDLEVVHAPGHTEGSVMFMLPGVPNGAADQGLDSTVLTGDVLFAGSIGRTDLAGGDHAAMQRTLRERVLPLDDAALILPGHGPATSMARERASNPYLLQLAAGRGV
jgi:glyoxylase-like metal-dependent hydrolase (beta-lactamase superfamily II)